jgi:ABC-type transport system involved in cytochrome c biogenesis permease subunit
VWSDAWHLGIPAAAFAGATVLVIATRGFPKRREGLLRAGAGAAAIAGTAVAAALAVRWWGRDDLMLNAQYDSVLLAILGVSVGTAVLLGRAARQASDPGARTAGPRAALPAALLGVGVALGGLGLDSETLYAPPAVRDPLVAPHYFLRAFGAGLLLTAGAAALGRLVDRRRDEGAGESWDGVLHGTVALGLPPLLLAIALGAAWHQDVWGGTWQWDVTESLPFAAVVFQLAWLHLRTVSPPGARGPALLLATAGLLAAGMFFARLLPGALDSLEVDPDY